jgi:N-acetylgalactosamine-6-sulfatase
MTRTLIKTLVFPALCGASALGAQEKSEPSPPNIVLIVADDLGWGDIAAHGHPEIKTPVLDQMIREGTDYCQWTVASPVCSPMRASVLTGKYPSRFSIHKFLGTPEQNRENGMSDWLDPKTTLLPRLLQDAGYTTAHFGKWHLSQDSYEAPHPKVYGYDRAAVWCAKGPSIFYKCPPTDDPHGAIDREAPEFLTVAAVNHSERFIRDSVGAGKPFFLNLWIHEPHTPVTATEEQKSLYNSVAEPERTYYACVTRADTQIGRIMNLLKELHIDEKTLVIFTSDNGPELQTPTSPKSVGSTGGLKGRKRSLMMGGIGTPFIVRWPGRLPADRVDKTSVINSVDILPTLCDIAGVSLPSEYQSDGVSFLPALEGKEFARGKDLFWDWRFEHDATQYGDYWWPAGAIRRGSWMLLLSQNGERMELYNLDDDRNQDNNVATAHPEIVAPLKIALQEWQKTIPEAPNPECINGIGN